MFGPWANKSKVGNKNNRPTYPGNQNNNNQSQRFNESNRKGFTRQEHLSFYLSDPKLKPSTRKVSPNDDTTYDTIFQTKSHVALILRVHMPPSSTSTSICPCPKMSLAGVQVNQHPWIDLQNRIIGYDVISSEHKWNFSGVTLAGAVDAVVTHLQLNPPNVVRIVDPTLKALQNRISGASTPTANGIGGGATATANGGSSSHYPPAPRDQPLPVSQVLFMDSDAQKQQASRLSNVELPRVPKTYPQFSSMSRAEMTTLLGNQTALQSTLEDMPVVAEMEILKESIMEGNSNIVLDNLEKQDDLTREYYQVKALQEGLRDKMKTYESLKSRQEELCKPLDKDEVLFRLKKAKRESLDESEELASSWLSGNEGAVNDFLETFLKQRTVHHVRAAKMERIENS